MKNQPGYPLPSGELGSDDIVCQLVYLPDRPEYWQAFYAALHYMTTWRAWERDDDKRGKDAAANWRAAFELTSECWRMACLQELQDDVAEILAIMQLGNPCCDDMDITDGDQYTDRVTDGEGDVPQNIIDAGYASGVGDWAGFDDYKCMIVHVTVNQMSARLNELNELVNEYGAIAGGAAAVAAILAVIFATGGVAIVFGIIAGVGAVSLLYDSLMGFPLLGNLADKVDTNHDELVCAMYAADGDVGALVALNDKIDELFTVAEALVLHNLNMGPTLKSLYAGRYDQQDIAEILYDAGYELDELECDVCSQIGEFRILDEWDDGTIFPFYLEIVGGYPDWAYNANRDSYVAEWRYDAAGAYLYTSVFGLITMAGLTPGAGDTVTIHQVRIEYKMSGASAGTFKLSLIDDTGTRNYTIDNELTWGLATVTPSPARVSTYNLNYIIRISTQDGTGFSSFINSIMVDFDVDQA